MFLKKMYIKNEILSPIYFRNLFNIKWPIEVDMPLNKTNKFPWGEKGSHNNFVKIGPLVWELMNNKQAYEKNFASFEVYVKASQRGFWNV